MMRTEAIIDYLCSLSGSISIAKIGNYRNLKELATGLVFYFLLLICDL